MRICIDSNQFIFGIAGADAASETLLLRLPRYELIDVGWQGERRVYGSVIHIDIIGDKVWLQHDGTNAVIADELVAAGIPPTAIVLGFRLPRVRQYTGFAVA